MTLTDQHRGHQSPGAPESAVVNYLHVMKVLSAIYLMKPQLNGVWDYWMDYSFSCDLAGDCRTLSQQMLLFCSISR